MWHGADYLFSKSQQMRCKQSMLLQNTIEGNLEEGLEKIQYHSIVLLRTGTVSCFITVWNIIIFNMTVEKVISFRQILNLYLHYFGYTDTNENKGKTVCASKSSLESLNYKFGDRSYDVCSRGPGWNNMEVVWK